MISLYLLYFQFVYSGEILESVFSNHVMKMFINRISNNNHLRLTQTVRAVTTRLEIA